MLFAEEDMERVTESLSGGEAARLVFARLMLEENNVLILDEPTNHLDLESIESLAETLKKYPGTLIFVSHDRYFVEKVAELIFEMTPGGYKYFSGTYEQFLRSKGEDYLKRDIDLSIKDSQPQTSKISDQKKEYVRLRRNKKKEHSRIKKRINQLEQDIHKIEGRLDEIETKLFSKELSQDHNKLNELSEEKEGLESKLMDLMVEWESAHKHFAEIEASLQKFAQKIAAL